MTELFNALATYLHDVFVIKFDGWVILGFVAQAFFTMRFRGAVDRIRTRAQKRDPGGVLVFLDRRRRVAADLCAVPPRSRFHRRARRWVCWSISAISISSSSPDGRARRRFERYRRCLGKRPDTGKAKNQNLILKQNSG